MEATRVFDLLQHQLATFPKPDSLAAKVNGTWKKWSTQDFLDDANAIGKGLIAVGVQPGDRVAIVSPNRPEWVLSDYACQHIGAISVPLYPTITAEDYAFIFADSGAKVVLVSSREQYDKAVEAIVTMGEKPALYSYDSIEGALNLEQLKAGGSNVPSQELIDRQAAVGPHDLFTIIYTSGTTGKPKGVMLTHNNLIKNIEGSGTCMPVDEKATALSFLPLCHVYERMVLGIYVRFGVSVYFAESMETIGDNLKEVKPELFTDRKSVV